MKYCLLILVVLVTHPTNSQEVSDAAVQTFLELLGNSPTGTSGKVQLSEDAGLNISQYLAKYKYPFESYKVTTEDGYIITLHRIPNGRNADISNSNKTTKPASLFVPGLSCSSTDWILLGPNKSLALLMADLGYDVWLLNTRGSRYSLNHQTLNSSEAKFWDYSFHEKGYYDIAASIDYIIHTTGLEQITLLGHSEGTSASMALTTARSEYNKKLNLMVLLSPVGYMGGVKSPIPVLLVKYLTTIQVIFNELGIYGIPYSKPVSEFLFSSSVNDNFTLFRNAIQLLCGYDWDELNLDYLELFLFDKPNGLSVKQLVHYGQEINTASFQRYDYGGRSKNMIYYGTPTPPSYDPSLITVPVAAYYSQNDFFAGVSDVEHLLEQIPNKADAYLIEYKNFNHLDFISAKDVKAILYDRVLSVIAKYSSNTN